jgi:hypothetical protein
MVDLSLDPGAYVGGAFDPGQASIEDELARLSEPPPPVYSTVVGRASPASTARGHLVGDSVCGLDEHFIGSPVSRSWRKWPCRRRGGYTGCWPVKAGRSARRCEPAGIAHRQRRLPSPRTRRKRPREDIHVSRQSSRGMNPTNQGVKLKQAFA